MKKVSIIIPMYNTEEWIASTLRCACSQTWPDVEIIVVDDGSTDNSYEVAKQFEHENVTLIRQENEGACAARNRALEEAQGDYIQYLDADDLMEADKIEVQMQRLDSASDGAVAAARWTRFYERIGDGPHPPVPEEWEHEDPFEWLIEAQAGRAMMPPIGWLIPRSIIEKAGPWNENLLINQDGEYFARVLLEAEQIVFCPETTVFYRSGLPSSVSGRFSSGALQSQYEAAELITHHLLDREDTLRVRQACADALQRVAYKAYPASKDVTHQAERRVTELGGSNWHPPGGGMLFRWLGKRIGWKLALWLRHHYRDLRYAS
jgi:glycosyltransferase involved in cell wall biosynthesis